MSNTTIIQLNNATLQINRYLSAILFLFGILGNLLCCLVFIQRTLRSNPCIIYFLIASISNIISLISGIPPRMLAGWSILPDRTETVSAFCKSRLIVLLTSRNISSWLLVFATIDRYLISSSNVNTRRMSNLKRSYYSIIFVCIGSLILWSESLYCFDANTIGTPIKCYAKSDICRIINDLAQAFFTTIIPSCFMLMFGLFTISNIRQFRRIRPTMNNNNNNHNQPVPRKKSDHSLTKMLFTQVISLTIFNLPQAIQKFYLTYTFHFSKSLNQIAIENFLFNIALILTFAPNCILFYLYILTSNLFRRRFYQFIRTILPLVN